MAVEKPVFITGNQNKADYLAKMLGIELEHQKVDLDELQSRSLDEIVEHKVRQAYQLIGRPALVEDVSLGFAAYDNLPGPFIKFFIDQPDGLEKLCRMLDPFEDRTALAECVFGYYDGEHLELLRGSLRGTITDHPRGENGFGWDKIFVPDGFDGKTRAQLNPSDDAKTYATIKPFAALREFLDGSQ
jgi:inosine triphosphate pyrophosphatase